MSKFQNQYINRLASSHLQRWASKHNVEIVDGTGWDEEKPGVYSAILTVASEGEQTTVSFLFDSNTNELTADY